jgi:hypothetical protein
LFGFDRWQDAAKLEGKTVSDELAPAPSADPAFWIAPRLSYDRTIGSLVPSGFEAYARIFHPAYQKHRECTWAEIAEKRGRTVGPGSTFESIAGVDPRYEAIPSGSPFDWGPKLGAPGGHLESTLASILANYTTTPDDLWFAVWVGYLDNFDEQFPTFGLAFSRDYLLVSGSIRVRPPREDIGYAADLWWPADEAWIARTDTDLDSTWIGASRTCIQQLIDSELEVMQLQFGERVYDP